MVIFPPEDGRIGKGAQKVWRRRAACPKAVFKVRKSMKASWLSADLSISHRPRKLAGTDLFSSEGRSALAAASPLAGLPIDVLAQDLALNRGTDWAPTGVLVPQCSTDDISTPSQLCIGCSQ